LLFDLADEVVAAFLKMTAQEVIRLVRHSTSPSAQSHRRRPFSVDATPLHVALSAQAHAWAIHLTRPVIESSIPALFFPWMKETFAQRKV
jgi:hypothetical protein